MGGVESTENSHFWIKAAGIFGCKKGGACILADFVNHYFIEK
jgi:hypothetical protein